MPRARTFKKFENFSNFFNTPYPESAVLNSISKEKNILIIGSRLTAIDLAMAFLSKSHKGKITLASRSGLMPMIRSESFNYTPKFISPATINKNINLNNITTLLQAEFRHLYADQPFSNPLKEFGCENDFIDEYSDTINHFSHWQNLASMFDEFIEACWVNIADNERMRFINKFLPLLTRYTATIPHETAGTITKHLLSNQLLIENSLLDLTPISDKKFIAEFKKSAGNTTVIYDTVINASGYAHKITTQYPYKNLLLTKKMKFNQFGGLDVSMETMKLNSHHNFSSTIYALGPPIFGTRLIVDFLLFIAHDANIIANDIVSEFCGPEGQSCFYLEEY